nr:MULTISPECIES: hypothetical protein [unclassified Bradyrhizobium]
MTLLAVLSGLSTKILKGLNATLTVHAFIRSECEEAAVRVALSDAAPLYRDAPEAREARASGERIVEAFMREALPKASGAVRDGGRSDHDDAKYGGQGFFREPANARRDRDLCRRHGRHVLRDLRSLGKR